eukprot:1059099-Pelagomonas_calceolata.AAC.3
MTTAHSAPTKVWQQHCRAKSKARLKFRLSTRPKIHVHMLAQQSTVCACKCHSWYLSEKHVSILPFAHISRAQFAHVRDAKQSPPSTALKAIASEHWPPSTGLKALA